MYHKPSRGGCNNFPRQPSGRVVIEQLLSPGRPPSARGVSLISESIVSPPRGPWHCGAERNGERTRLAVADCLYLAGFQLDKFDFLHAYEYSAGHSESRLHGSCRRGRRKPLQEARSIQESSSLNYTPLRIRTVAREFAAGFPPLGDRS